MKLSIIIAVLLIMSISSIGITEDDTTMSLASNPPESSSEYLALDGGTGDILIGGISIWDMDREEVRRVVREVVKTMNNRYVK